MVLNLIIGETMLAFGEALVPGEAMGLSRQYLLEMILGSHVAAPFLNTKRAKIASDQYEADFPLKLMQKNLQIATTTAYEKGVAISAAGTAKEIYTLAARHGLAEQDYSAIYSFLSQGQPADKWK